MYSQEAWQMADCRWQMADGKMADGKMADGRWQDGRWQMAMARGKRKYQTSETGMGGST